MKLFSFWRSLATYRVRIALNLKGIPYDYLAVDLRSEQHLGAAQRVCDPADLVATLDAWCSGKTAVVPGGDC